MCGAIASIDFSVSTHSRPKAAGYGLTIGPYHRMVSTHSRPKAAGYADDGTAMALEFQHTAARRRLVIATTWVTIFKGFNTQPPEGGWNCETQTLIRNKSFNTQPPEGGWLLYWSRRRQQFVSTHSRPKAAGYNKPT